MRISHLCGLALLVGCNQSGVTTQQFQDLRDRVDELEAENDALQEALDEAASGDALSALDTRVSDLDTRVSTLEGESIRLIAEDTTLDVPGDHASLQDALAWLDGYRIAGDVWVTILLAPGTYAFSEGIVFQHPNGHRISIEGYLGDPAATVLHYTGNTDPPDYGRALRARSSGATVGWLDWVTVRGDDTAGTIGIEASDGGTFWVGPNVVVEGFGRAGFRATRGGSVYAEGATATSNPGHGFLAENGSYLAAWGATASDNGGHGFHATESSAISASPATATGNGQNGFAAWSGGVITAWNATASNNGWSGFEATGGGFVAAASATSRDNAQEGYHAWLGAAIQADNSEALDNGATGYQVATGSALHAPGSDARRNGQAGFRASDASAASVKQSTANDNGYTGFVAGPTSALRLQDATADDNAEDAVSAHGYGFADATGALASDSGDYTFDVSLGGWVIATDSSSGGAATEEYRVGPWPLTGSLPEQDGLGVIWEVSTE